MNLSDVDNRELMDSAVDNAHVVHNPAHSFLPAYPHRGDC